MSDLKLQLPVNAQPTEILAQRFATWRKIIRAINVYLREVASVQDEVVRQNIRLGHAMNIPFFENGTSDPSWGDRHKHGEFLDREDTMFLPYGNSSLSDLPGNIIAFHRAQAAAASRTSKELSHHVIPRLEDLRRDLLVKIKEIKNLSGDFKNSVAKEQEATANQYNAYANAIGILGKNSSLLPPKQDPYLLKSTLDGQINRQVNEENYLLEAFLNLQGSGRELEKVVAQEVQQALIVFGKLMGIQASNLNDLLVNKILQGFAAKEPVFEWDLFIARDPNFVDPATKPRSGSDVSYENQHSSLAKEIRSGYLERRSKYLKSYSRAWYVLTPTFLHEFKSQDRKHDPHPIMSLSLDECQLSEDKKGSSISHRFILNAKQNGNGSRGHNWVFRAESKEKLNEWYTDLRTLTSIPSPIERAKRFDPNAAMLEVPASVTSAAAIPLPPSKAGSHTDEYHQVVPPISSPVPSDTSAVTSTGEPYAEEEQEAELPAVAAGAAAGAAVASGAAVHEQETAATEKTVRGRFPSEVNLDHPVDAAKATDQETLHLEAATFILPPDIAHSSSTAIDDAASVFSYDLKHNASTFHDDTDFKPVDHDIPVQLERRLTQSHRQEEEGPLAGIGVPRLPDEAAEDPQQVLMKRKDSVISQKGKRTPSRRATGSFGGHEELRPLSALDSSNQSAEPPLFFANGLPQTTGGAGSKE